MKFHLEQNEVFQSGVSSISYNCLHEIPRKKTLCGCYFIAVILTEMKFHFR